MKKLIANVSKKQTFLLDNGFLSETLLCPGLTHNQLSWNVLLFSSYRLVNFVYVAQVTVVAL